MLRLEHEVKDRREQIMVGYGLVVDEGPNRHTPRENSDNSRRENMAEHTLKLAGRMMVEGRIIQIVYAKEKSCDTINGEIRKIVFPRGIHTHSNNRYIASICSSMRRRGILSYRQVNHVGMWKVRRNTQPLGTPEIGTLLKART